MPLHPDQPRRSDRPPPALRSPHRPPSPSPSVRGRAPEPPGDASNWCESTPRRAAAAVRVPRPMRTSCVRTLRGASCWCATVPGRSEGRSCQSVPPAATLTSWSPRQMASTGSPRACAASRSASSKASRSGSTEPELRRRWRAVPGGRDVGASAEQQPVHARRAPRPRVPRPATGERTRGRPPASTSWCHVRRRSRRSASIPLTGWTRPLTASRGRLTEAPSPGRRGSAGSSYLAGSSRMPISGIVAAPIVTWPRTGAPVTGAALVEQHAARRPRGRQDEHAEARCDARGRRALHADDPGGIGPADDGGKCGAGDDPGDQARGRESGGRPSVWPGVPELGEQHRRSRQRGHAARRTGACGRCRRQGPGRAGVRGGVTWRLSG